MLVKSRVAHREHPIAHLEGIAVPQKWRSGLGVNLKDGDVGGGVAADEGGRDAAVVVEAHWMPSAPPMMMVRDDEPVLGKDDATAEPS